MSSILTLSARPFCDAIPCFGCLWLFWCNQQLVFIVAFHKFHGSYVLTLLSFERDDRCKILKRNLTKKAKVSNSDVWKLLLKYYVVFSSILDVSRVFLKDNSVVKANVAYFSNILSISSDESLFGLSSSPAIILKVFVSGIKSVVYILGLFDKIVCKRTAIPKYDFLTLNILPTSRVTRSSSIIKAHRLWIMQLIVYLSSWRRHLACRRARFGMLLLWLFHFCKWHQWSSIHWNSVSSSIFSMATVLWDSSISPARLSLIG